jgi:TorA maturation chaperone TorD
MVTAGRELFLLTSRLLSEEIDVPLYRALLEADSGHGGTGAGRPLVDAGLRALDEALAVEELAVEFCRLFVGPRPTCSPYESVQRGEPVVGGRAERRFREYLHRHGMAVTPPPGLAILSDDHLAVQLAVLHRVCEQAAHPEAPPDAAGALHEVLDHLLPWAPAYLRDLGEGSRLAPYRTIADLTARLLTAGGTAGQDDDHRRTHGKDPRT